MRNESVIETLKRAIAEEPTLNLDPAKIRDDVPLMDGGLDLDSIGILEVITLVESTFPIQFKDEDLQVSTFVTLKTLSDVISQRMDD